MSMPAGVVMTVPRSNPPAHGSEDDSEAAHAGDPTECGSAVGLGVVSPTVAYTLVWSLESSRPAKKTTVYRDERHRNAHQIDEDGGQGKPDHDDPTGADPVGDAAGDEHADDAADIEHGAEDERVAGRSRARP